MQLVPKTRGSRRLPSPVLIIVVQRQGELLLGHVDEFRLGRFGQVQRWEHLVVHWKSVTHLLVVKVDKSNTNRVFRTVD